MIEEWKIIGENNNYAVSNTGKIKNVKTDRILRPVKNTFGYMQIGLNKNGKTSFRLVHRLVAQAFIPNPENLSDVTHKDYNKENNIVENLEWVNHKKEVKYINLQDNPDKIIDEMMNAVKNVLIKYIK